MKQTYPLQLNIPALIRHFLYRIKNFSNSSYLDGGLDVFQVGNLSNIGSNINES
jgi:hypothetical protein